VIVKVSFQKTHILLNQESTPEYRILIAGCFQFYYLSVFFINKRDYKKLYFDKVRIKTNRKSKKKIKSLKTVMKKKIIEQENKQKDFNQYFSIKKRTFS
jgi:hypothetical protein